MILGGGDEAGVGGGGLKGDDAEEVVGLEGGRLEPELRQCAGCGNKIHSKFLLKV